jgi:hypothetical protein
LVTITFGATTAAAIALEANNPPMKGTKRNLASHARRRRTLIYRDELCGRETGTGTGGTDPMAAFEFGAR